MNKRASENKESLSLRTYRVYKKKYPYAIVVVDAGQGQYRTFLKDAELVSSIVKVYSLPGGDKVPVTILDEEQLNCYLPRIVKEGHKVAICSVMDFEALEKESKARQLSLDFS